MIQNCRRNRIRIFDADITHVSPEIRLHRNSIMSVNGRDRPSDTKHSQMDRRNLQQIANAILEIPALNVSQDAEIGGPRESDTDTSEVE